MKEAVENRKNHPQRALAEPYLKGIARLLVGSGEAALRRGYEFGRDALAEGHSILEILDLHHTTLQRLLENAHYPEAVSAVLRGAGAFLAEVLSPYEMTHRGFREAVSAVRHLNEMLNLRLSASLTRYNDEAGQLLVAVHLALCRSEPGSTGATSRPRGTREGAARSG